MKTLYKDSTQLLPFLIEQLRSCEGKTSTLPLRGYSMRPFLEDGRDRALLTAAHPALLRVGDVVLAEYCSGHYVLHRIVALTDHEVILRGDGNVQCERCLRSQVYAVALGFYRKGHARPDLTSGFKWRCYSWWWMRLLPIRRYLLFIYRHIFL